MTDDEEFIASGIVEAYVREETLPHNSCKIKEVY